MTTQIEKLRELYDKHGEFPAEWTRYLALDPGTAKAAVLFGVVPPPSEYGNRLIIEDEIFALRMPPMQLAPEVFAKTTGRRYEAFVIDCRAGRQTPMGGERTIEEQYAHAFAQFDVECVQTGSHFYYGSDDPMSRANEVREWLYPEQKGGPRLLFVLERLPQTLKEFRLYERKIRQGKAADGRLVTEEAQDRYNDCMNALEYMVSIVPGWVDPPVKAKATDPGYAQWEKRKKAKDRSNRGLRLESPATA